MANRARGAAGALAVAVVLALTSAVLGAAAAAADPLPEPRFGLSFDGMLPGETRSAAVPYAVPVEAVLRTGTVEIVEGADAGFTWRVRLCGAAGTCADLTEGMAVTAGEYLLTTEVTLDPAAQPSVGSSIRAHLTFVEATEDDPSGLPVTGSPSGALLVLAALATGLGLVLVALGRRRRDDGEERA